MTTTPRLGLPVMEAGQAQKHVTHNEALLDLDAQVHLSVVDRTTTTPPATPGDTDRWLVPAGASGAWAGAAGTVAFLRNGAWAFLAPRRGWLCWIEAENRLLVHGGPAGWREVIDAAGLLDTTALADGSVDRIGLATAADTVNRLAVKSDAVLFSHDDVSGSGSGNVRIAVDKAAPARDAALLFETAWSGRALFGLLGDDDLTLKVSSDGSTWTEALRVAAAGGRLTLPPGGLAGGGRLLATRLYTASATWTRPTGVRFVFVWAIGGGGGGGGAAGGTATGAAGGGGGGGALALRFLDVAAIASRAVTIGTGGTGGLAGATGGAGGASSFGSEVVAGGGSGGSGMAAAAWATAVTGGLGGTASAGDLLCDGEPGSAGLRFDAGNVLSGSGGRSHFGGGARGNVGALAGAAATTRGAGGAGGAAASSTTGFAGGAGAAGLVMLWEFE